MSNTTALVKPDYERPVPILKERPTVDKPTFGHRWQRITTWTDNPDDAIKMPLNFGIDFIKMSSFSIGEYPTEFGITNHITIDLICPIKGEEGATGEWFLKWNYGYNGEIGCTNSYGKTLIQVHTASLVAQLDILLQQGIALTDISGTIYTEPWKKTSQAALYVGDKQVPYKYSPDDRRPDLFTHRANKIASSLGCPTPFLLPTNNDVEAGFQIVPVIQSNEDDRSIECSQSTD